MPRDYTLIRSRRRTLSLELGPDGEAIVRAPNKATLAEIDAFVDRNREWLAQQRAKQTIRAIVYPEPTPEEEQYLKSLAKVIIPQRVAYYSERMGLRPTGVKITSAKGRFGSCSPTNSLCFSWRLMEYPREAVDYVVVHELAHIVHKDHQAGFYALVASVLPDYQRRKAMLRR